VVTTSGTAVAELIPAAVEATYSQVPLIFITADRPRSYRGTGAPQSIEQVGIFSHYVERMFDIASTEEALHFEDWSGHRPMQINLCFAEPLIDAEIPALKFQEHEPQKVKNFSPAQTKHVEQPLVIAGPMELHEAQMLKPHLLRWQAPIYAESLSQLSGDPDLQPLFLKGGEKSVADIFEKKWCRSVLRVGGVPTLRFWRDLEDKYQTLPVVSLSSGDYTGLSRPAGHLVGLQNGVLLETRWSEDHRRQIFEEDQIRSQKLRALLQKYPQSEQGMLFELTKKIAGSFMYVGNSLPIRAVDLVLSRELSFARISGNRGANGIDGQISSFLGLASIVQENWAVIGDLTALYDLSGLWATRFLSSAKIRIVVINNHGGQIFKNMFQKKIFLNEHDLHFNKWAEMWGFSYEQWAKVPGSLDLPAKCILELTPDASQTDLFVKESHHL
jgi:2-succinyl-5-enolpyruvyl-6-hydroxy-3-cyclohexene-1-carboxylate synthase